MSSRITIQSPSAQSLYIELYFNEKKLSSGTGFLAECRTGHVLITNRHNVTGRNQNDHTPMHKCLAFPNSVKIFHHKKGELGKWVEQIEPLYSDPNYDFNDDSFVNKLWTEHPSLGAKADIVALPITKTENVDFYPYVLQPSHSQVRIGPADVVSVVGFPLGLTAGGYFPVCATGFVATEPSIDYDDKPTLLIDCRSRKGQSGSPVIAFRNGGLVEFENGNSTIGGRQQIRLVGVYSGRVNEESDLGIVWKTACILELVNSI